MPDRNERAAHAGPRPPWWPTDEPWPPARGGWPGRRGRRHGRGFGCLFGALFLVGLSVLLALATGVLYVVGLLGGDGRPGVVQVLAVLVVLGGIVAFLGSGRFLRRTGTTLDALVEATRRVEDGDYGARVEVPRGGPRPLRDLARGFNTMATRLETDERQRRSLLADVSHELRTPLAVVQGNLEAILDGVHPADEAHVETILDETRVLARLIEDLRTLALSEAGTLTLHPEPTDVGVLATDVLAGFRATADRQGVVLETAIADELPLIAVDPIRLREVIENLLSNALRYTPRGGTIRLSVAQEAEGADLRLVVADTGSGIPAELVPRLFDRFARGDDSSGSGLGLAIARALVVAHGGTIEAASAQGVGTTVTVCLPVDR